MLNLDPESDKPIIRRLAWINKNLKKVKATENRHLVCKKLAADFYYIAMFYDNDWHNLLCEGDGIKIEWYLHAFMDSMAYNGTVTLNKKGTIPYIF